jgi:serpin B
MRLVDFIAEAEAARVAINAWVAERTNDRIPELLPPGVVDATTRLVLVNAIYLHATWAEPFSEDRTAEAPFTLNDGTEVTVEMMHRDGGMRYGTGDGWQAVELDYVGNELAMLLVVPDAGRYAEVEAGVADGLLDEAAASLRDRGVALAMPRFEVRTEASLVAMLSRLGMPTAFTPEADFSGMTDETALWIDEVVHEAWIRVNESGTEAAAATAVAMRMSAVVTDVELEIDRPFLFALRDRETGTILFMGRVLDPTA